MAKVGKVMKLSSMTLAGIVLAGAPIAFAGTTSHARSGKAASPTRVTTQISGPAANTPIQHVVVIYDENVSFDHYFATYPVAKNTAGEPPFYASPGTPAINGLTPSLLNNNPNLANPQLLDRSQAQTDDMDHNYTAEQAAFDGGKMDKFVQATGAGSWPAANQSPNVVMDYYDGNTVTALWNYAQHFSMSDNSFGTTFGPSTPGALNLIAGQTNGATAYSANVTQNGTKLQLGDKGYPSSLNSNGTLFGDVNPYYDMASTGQTIKMTGNTIGDLMNNKGMTWGWFEGGYAAPTVKHTNVGGTSSADYSPHHNPFAYYPQFANPNHLGPTSSAMIGQTDQAGHQYDLTNFWQAADGGNLPNVSFLKAPSYQDGHAGYSDPLDEQTWLVNTMNHLESLPSWQSTAVFISWDDSDGWYDHVMGPLVNGSNDAATDVLAGKGDAGTPMLGGYLDRAGYGPRLPMLVISPYAKRNFVASSVSDQSSIIQFVEDNWNLGRLGNGSYDAIAGTLGNMFDFTTGYHNSSLILDPTTGEPVTKITPFSQHGQQYLSISDLAQSLNVQFQQTAHEAWFTYNHHTVVVPFHGHSVTVDMKPVDLGAPITAAKGAICIPIANVAKALGVRPVQYKSNEILFQTVQ